MCWIALEIAIVALGVVLGVLLLPIAPFFAGLAFMGAVIWLAAIVLGTLEALRFATDKRKLVGTPCAKCPRSPLL